MTKKLSIVCVCTFISMNIFAGGLLTNTNQSVHFLRNPARDASTEIDAVYTNPAGLTFLSDGLHLSFNNQSAFQTRTITSTFLGFKYAEGNNESTTKAFKGEASAPIIPSLQIAYKKDKMTYSASFAVSGGGGKATFNDGLPSFESPLSLLPYKLTTIGLTTKNYSVDSYMEGRQFIYGIQLNGSYKITSHLSGAVGMRLNIVNSAYYGYLKDIKINPIHPLVNPTGTMISAPTFFTTIGSSANAAATADKELDCTQTGWGVTPILGVNYNINNLNIGAKYEFITKLNIQNDTKVNTTGVAAYDDGVNTPNDIPALLTVGAEYKICESLKVSGGYHHFFDSDAKMANNRQKNINGGINEFLLGTEYNINKSILISAGGQLTRTGVNDAYQTDMSFSLNSYSIGFGGAVNITPDLRLNLAYFFTNYSDWTKDVKAADNNNAGYNATTLAGKDVYARTNKVFGIGLDYKF